MVLPTPTSKRNNKIQKMISKLAEKYAKLLLTQNMIYETDFEIYHYGLFVLLSNVLLLMYCLIVGAIFKIVFCSFLYYLFFFILHKFSGGFHVKTELCCQVITLLSFFLGMMAIKHSTLIKPQPLILVYIICSVLLIVLSPAETPQKPLTKKECSTFKKLTSLVVLIGILTVVILNVLELYIEANTLVVTVVLQTISVILGKLLNKKLLSNNI